MNRIFFNHSINQIVAKLQSKDIKPSDVTGAALHNIRELNPKYFAWLTYGNEELFDTMRAQMDMNCGNNARLLENIPIAVKDIFNTADFPTQMGSPLWKDFTPGNDARAVFHLKRRGALVMGKTITAEFAVHALNETLNPYDPARTPGTSSSGSAVAVALGMVPASIGTQTAGSIIRPASFCGIYGCKPSFGLIPRTGVLKTTDTLDTIGFFAIYLEDLRTMFDSLRVRGKNYPISNKALGDPSRQKKLDSRPWRIGFAQTHTWENAPDYARAALNEFIKKLATQKNIEVIDTVLSKKMQYTHTIHETIYNKALSYYFKREYKQSHYVSPIMNELIQKGGGISAEEYKKNLERQVELIREMDSFFLNYNCDILISLSTAGEAPLRNVTESPDPALMWTLTHLPAINVPIFRSPNKMPFGLQVVTRKYNDYLLFEFLNDLQARELIPVKNHFS